MSTFEVTKTIVMPTTPEKIWTSLTDVSLMPKWMSETGMKVTTDWIVGNSIVIEGRWYKMKYKNIGKVLEFDLNRLLSYSHLSSLSRIADIPENHSHLNFHLDRTEEGTLLRLAISNSPTYEIHKHLDFYWNVTLAELSKFAQSL
jgi:uncharacterized protein YndB with AHSA1/START domain